MNKFLIIGITVLFVGICYGYWSLFIKKKKVDPNIFSKVDNSYDRSIPILLIISGIIMILKNV